MSFSMYCLPLFIRNKILRRLSSKDHVNAKMVSLDWFVGIELALRKPMHVSLCNDDKNCLKHLKKCTRQRLDSLTVGNCAELDLPIYSTRRTTLPIADTLIIERGNSMNVLQKLLLYYVNSSKALQLPEYSLSKCPVNLANGLRLELLTNLSINVPTGKILPKLKALRKKKEAKKRIVQRRNDFNNHFKALGRFMSAAQFPSLNSFEIELTNVRKPLYEGLSKLLENHGHQIERFKVKIARHTARQTKALESDFKKLVNLKALVLHVPPQPILNRRRRQRHLTSNPIEKGLVHFTKLESLETNLVEATLEKLIILNASQLHTLVVRDASFLKTYGQRLTSLRVLHIDNFEFNKRFLTMARTTNTQLLLLEELNIKFATGQLPVDPLGNRFLFPWIRQIGPNLRMLTTHADRRIGRGRGRRFGRARRRPQTRTYPLRFAGHLNEFRELRRYEQIVQSKQVSWRFNWGVGRRRGWGERFVERKRTQHYIIAPQIPLWLYKEENREFVDVTATNGRLNQVTAREYGPLF